MSTDSRSKPLTAAIVFLSATRLLVNTSQRFVGPFLPAIARGIGISLGQAGLLVSARWLVGLLVPGVVGVVGRGERRVRLYLFGLMLFAAGAAVTAATSAFWGALVGFVMLGLAKPVHDIAAQAYVADRTPYAQRARNMSFMELSWAGGLLIGAPLAGYLIDIGGWTLPFWLFTTLATLAMLVAAQILEPDIDVDRAKPEKLALDGAAWGLLVVAGLFSLAAENMTLIIGAWLEDGFALSLVSLGLVSTVVGLGELGGEGLVLTLGDRFGKRRMVMVGLLVSIASFALFAPLSGSLALGLLAVAIGLGGFEISIVAAIPLATEQRPQARARFLAMLVASFALSRAIGAALGPYLFVNFGLGWNVVAAVVADVLALIILLRVVRDH